MTTIISIGENQELDEALDALARQLTTGATLSRVSFPPQNEQGTPTTTNAAPTGQGIKQGLPPLRSKSQQGHRKPFGFGTRAPA